MVLASGCGSKTLVRIGGGNLKSLVVFIVLGVAAFATLRGITAVLRVATVDRVALELAGGQDLPSLAAAAFGLAKAQAALVLGAAIGGALVLWTLARAEGRSADVLLGGAGIGAVVAAMWCRVGWATLPKTPTRCGPSSPPTRNAWSRCRSWRRSRTRSTGCCSSATRASC
jgi:uncharacterized membrane protein YedE/YeeE